ncbi:molybdopterin-binding protein [Pseudonocardia sp. CNS-139]|nr:molybdopterin-binding protein [Pseudonocardia sp. CNS-139]
MLAVAAAVAAGHLVAGIVSPGSSPFLAVGDAVVRLSPQWLTEFAKSAFGTADKVVLLAAMGVVIAGVAAGAGLLTRRRTAPGTAVVSVLGLAGFAAVMAQPAFAPLDLLAPSAALLAGIVVLRRLHALAGRSAQSAARPARESGSEGTRVAVSRRDVLVWASAGVGAASLLAIGGGTLLSRGAGDSRATVTARLAAARLAQAAPPIPAGAAFPELGTPTFLTAAASFYRIDVALGIPRLAAEDWTLRVHGMVDREVTLTFDDLMARPLVERTITMTCVSNPVGGDLISTANFVGIDLRDLLLEAGVRPGADQAFATSVDGWYTGTPVDVLMQPDRGAMLAVGMNGEALLPEHGFPVRMVVPGLYGYVSATKWISDLELTTFAARSGYWLERGWAERGPVKTGSRIDRPRSSSTVPAGTVTLAGIAWSQPDGITRVEVRADGGPWVVADLASDVSGDTWRMWRADLDLVPGEHTLEARATAGTGTVQPEPRTSPIPDGATGWPAVLVTAR